MSKEAEQQIIRETNEVASGLVDRRSFLRYLLAAGVAAAGVTPTVKQIDTGNKNRAEFLRSELPSAIPFDIVPSRKNGLFDILCCINGQQKRVNMLMVGFNNNSSEMQGDQGSELETIKQEDNTATYGFSFNQNENLNGEPGGRSTIRQAAGVDVEFKIDKLPDNSADFTPKVVSGKSSSFDRIGVGLTYGLLQGVVGFETPGSTHFVSESNIQETEEEMTLGQFRHHPGADRFRTLSVYEEMPIIQVSVSTPFVSLLAENRKNPWVIAHKLLHDRLKNVTGFNDWYEMIIPWTLCRPGLSFKISVHQQPSRGEKYSSQDTLDRYLRFRGQQRML